MNNAALTADAPLRRTDILRRAWPVMLANAAVPLLGLSDTAVIGNTGSLAALGAIAFGAIIFSFVYWGFGFLRMGTTGFTAQAVGAGDEAEVRTVLWRALLLAAGLGLLLIALQTPISTVSLSLMNGSESVDALTRDYIAMRIWGAPAALALFALMGCLIGLGHSKTLLLVQVFLNGLNITLDIWFAGVLGMGVEGIALGTAVAEWSSVGLALFLVLRILRQRHHDGETFVPLSRLRDWTRLRHTLSVNSHIMIRTLLLVFSFAWFVRQSAQFGDDVLAANHILLQLISFSAFFLDAYAYVTEALVGEAAGAKNRRRFDEAVRKSSELAIVTAGVLAVIILLGGEFAAQWLSTHEQVWHQVSQVLPWAALYVLLAVVAFQLDGIFIGTTRTREMRNAAVVGTVLFLPLSLIMIKVAANHGLWLSFVVYVCLRAICLLVYMPALRRSVHVATHSVSGDARR
ncbi:MAG: MATE family efflux transporter [Gammaproteobacteria bacterium]|nr:MATE family efflux transporter [Gammaproteobacteria bacterium]